MPHAAGSAKGDFWLGGSTAVTSPVAGLPLAPNAAVLWPAQVVSTVLDKKNKLIAGGLTACKCYGQR